MRESTPTKGPWKQSGGGSSVIKWAAVGGAGKLPPVNYHSMSFMFKCVCAQYKRVLVETFSFAGRTYCCASNGDWWQLDEKRIMNEEKNYFVWGFQHSS